MLLLSIKKILPLSIVLGCLVLASWFLYQPGFIPTHDGEYHIIRFYEFEKMLRAGYWFPRWAAGLNSGYGVPLFNFHYPLPNYVGVFFHLAGWGLTDAFKLTLATGYLLAGVCCFFWLAKFFNKSSALVGSIVFAFIPYWFVNIYVRGAVGEVMAIAWFMLALVCIERNWKTLFTFTVSAIVLSHNIQALILLPVLFGYLVLRKPKGYWLSLFLGIGLATYFWLPALAERDLVVGLNTVNFRDYFPALYQLLIPSWGAGLAGSGFSGTDMSPQIGIIPLLVIGLSLFTLKSKLARESGKITKYFFLVIGILFFFMLEISLPIWERVPFLAYIQYPWRFLSVFIPVVAFLSARIIQIKRKLWLSSVIIAGAVILVYPYSRPVTYLPRNDSYYLSRREFTDGTSSLGNSFSTRWSAWKSVRPDHTLEVVKGKARVDMLQRGPLVYSFRLLAFEASIVRANLLYYPGWTLELDKNKESLSYDQDGVMTFTAMPGRHSGVVYFTETPLRLTADILSLISLFWIIVSVILKANYAYSYRHHAASKRS